MRHDPAGASIVIMLRSLKLHGMAQAVDDLMAQALLTLEHVGDEGKVQESSEHDIELFKAREDAAIALEAANRRSTSLRRL